MSILDFDFVRFINFEAEIHFPEEEGIVQIENFGMHLNVDGTAIKIEAILDHKADFISLDHLSRCWSIFIRTRRASWTTFFPPTREPCSTWSFWTIAQRAGYNVILAEGIDPFLHAVDYMDRQDNENELKQVLGDLFNSHDIGDHGVCIMGKDGLLVAGPDFPEHEPLIVAYCSLLTRGFVRNFFIRAFILGDSLAAARFLILNYLRDPASIAEIRGTMSDIGKNLVLTREIMLYLSESIEAFVVPDVTGPTNSSFMIFSLCPSCSMTFECASTTLLSSGHGHELRR